MKQFFARFYLDFKKVVYILLVSVCIGLALLPTYKVLEVLELKAYDYRILSDTRLKKNQGGPSLPAGKLSDKTILVAIDDASLNAIEDNWPWPRRMHAEVITAMKKDGVALIGLDVYFISPSKYGPEDDRALVQAIGEAGNVVLASYFAIPDRKTGKKQLIDPMNEYKAQAAGTGFSGGMPDADNHYRTIILFHKKNNVTKYAFALEILINYLSDLPVEKEPEGDSLVVTFPAATAAELMTSRLEIPVAGDGNNELRVDFSPDPFVGIISFKDVLDGNYPPGLFKDKIAVIGPTAQVLHDIVLTPRGHLAGATLQTTAMRTMLYQTYISRIPRSVNIIIHFLCAALTAFIVMLASPIIGIICALVLLISHAVISFFLFAKASVWIDVVNPLLAILLAYTAITLLKLVWSTLENMKLYKLAITDGLTDLFVHKYFQLKFREERSRALRHGLPLSLLITDIDHFKSFNDTYGHQTGDDVLKVVAATLKKSCRGTDTVARYGGEEFGLIMPHTDHQGALNMAERVRVNVEKIRVPYKDTALQVTTSIGVSTLEPGDDTECEQLIKQADMSLYHAKETGRNRVVGFPTIRELVDDK